MRIISTLAVSSLAVCAVLAATPAQAQATRTWVSGVGDDANPCSRTAPCKTFAGAISKTATAGEINCLDPGGFGGLTITKSISIVCQYTEGGVLTAGAGVNGFVVNATSTSHIYLKGLDFHGAGSAQNGLRVLVAASVTLEESSIRAFNASNGLGISFQPSATTHLTIINSTISNNGSGATGGGILVQPTGASGNGRITLRNVRVTNNANNGLFVNTTGNTNLGGIQLVVNGSEFSGNGSGIVINQPVGTNSVGMMLISSTVSNNNNLGLSVTGPGNVVRVADTTISANFTGLSVSGGSSLESYGTNRVFLNGNNGAFSAPIVPQN